jgi:hypothetical protein
MQTTETIPGVPNRRSRSSETSFAPSTAAWYKLAVVYLLASVALGVAMGASENFTLRSLHTHLSLLGWTTLALAGLIYHQFPEARRSRLGVVHFWLYNLALPPMMGSLAALLLGYPGAVPILAASQTIAAIGLLAFAINVFTRVRP